MYVYAKLPYYPWEQNNQMEYISKLIFMVFKAKIALLRDNLDFILSISMGEIYQSFLTLSQTQSQEYWQVHYPDP